jgi:Na+/H+ antiporter NhaD/arsenite permease-like protein
MDRRADAARNALRFFKQCRDRDDSRHDFRTGHCENRDHGSVFTRSPGKSGDQKVERNWAMSLSVGMLSGLIQNIGAAALFLPGILTISRREKIPASALIMPIGFAAIVGGTLSMVGSGPLILINDLLRGADLAPYGLFSVTPVGMLLLLSGIGFFFVFGKFVLPHSESRGKSVSEQDKLIEALHLPHHIWHYAIPQTAH